LANVGSFGLFPTMLQDSATIELVPMVSCKINILGSCVLWSFCGSLRPKPLRFLLRAGGLLSKQSCLKIRKILGKPSAGLLSNSCLSKAPAEERIAWTATATAIGHQGAGPLRWRGPAGHPKGGRARAGCRCVRGSVLSLARAPPRGIRATGADKYTGPCAHRRTCGDLDGSSHLDRYTCVGL